MIAIVISPRPRQRTTGGGALLVALLTTILAQGAHAQSTTIVDSMGFELPKFDPAFSNPQTSYTGQLEGQAIYPEPLPVGTWMRTKNTGNSKATVVNTIAAPGGTQSVKVERAPNSDVRWGVPVSGWPSQRYVCIDWDMWVEKTALPPNSFGPFFGVEAYDDDAATIGLLASLGVDASNGELLYQVQGSGYLVAPGPVVPFGVWNHFNLLLDFVDHDFELYLNMVEVPTLPNTNGFVDHFNIAGGLNEFTDATISGLGAGGDATSLGATGVAYFDNFKVVQGATNPCVPEPSSWVLGAVGLGLGGFLAHRRRKVAC